MSKSEFKQFYNSKQWQITRKFKLIEANYKCENCGNFAQEVHHILHLTKDNIKDINITLKSDNLKVLCKVCHNKEHNRFSKCKQSFDKD